VTHEEGTKIKKPSKQGMKKRETSTRTEEGNFPQYEII